MFTSRASSIALRTWIWGFKISGPASLFLLAASAASVLARSSRLSEPVPYMAPVFKEFGIDTEAAPELKLVDYVEQLVGISDSAHVYGLVVGKGRMIPLGCSSDAMCYSGRVQQS